MTGKITLVGSTTATTHDKTVTTRPVTPADAEALARLYFASYDTEDL